MGEQGKYQGDDEQDPEEGPLANVDGLEPAVAEDDNRERERHQCGAETPSPREDQRPRERENSEQGHPAPPFTRSSRGSAGSGGLAGGGLDGLDHGLDGTLDAAVPVVVGAGVVRAGRGRRLRGDLGRPRGGGGRCRVGLGDGRGRRGGGRLGHDDRLLPVDVRLELDDRRLDGGEVTLGLGGLDLVVELVELGEQRVEEAVEVGSGLVERLLLGGGLGGLDAVDPSLERGLGHCVSSPPMRGLICC